MKSKFHLDGMSLTDVENLCNLFQDFESDINANSGSKDYDAKSFVALANLSMSPFSVEIITNDKAEIERFRKVCESYGAN